MFLSAYSEHLNMSIRPDDIWHMIWLSFSHYVNTHAETIRSSFVDHQGQKELTVVFNNETLASLPIDEMVKAFKYEIYKNVNNPELEKVITNGKFSTTTLDDEIVIDALLMTTLQKYFSYNCVLLCGFHNITIQGTVSDWTKLLTCVSFLDKFEDLKMWHKQLTLIIKKFIDALTEPNKIDTDFWNRCVFAEALGSGGQTTYDGWIIQLCPFDKEGDYHETKMDGSNFISSKSSVPIKINDNGVIYNTSFETNINIYQRNNMLMAEPEWTLYEI